MSNPSGSWTGAAVTQAQHGVGGRAASRVQCRRCGNNVQRKLLGRATDSLSLNYCATCRPLLAEALPTLRAQAAAVLGSEGPLSQSWTRVLSEFATHTGVDAVWALAELQDLSAETLRRYAAFALSDGVVTDEELRQVRAASDAMQCLPEIALPLLQHLQRQHSLCRVRDGDLPEVPVRDLHLSYDERCHADMPATLERRLARGPAYTPGRLLLTNRKFRFIAPSNGAELAWQKVLRVRAFGVVGLRLETSGRGVNGVVRVADPEWAVAVADTLIRIDRRAVVPGVSRRDTSVVPQWVKTQVWQRDQGRCRECDADSYLEFDHVIPRSRGGATSVENLQLLCRSCNLRKGDRL